MAKPCSSELRPAGNRSFTLRTLLGGLPFESLDILTTSQYPLSYVMPSTASAHPASVAEWRAILCPHKTVAVQALPAVLTPQPQNTQTLIDVVAVIATKEDRCEVENMRTGMARSAGLFMAGTWNKTTGKIASLAMSKSTVGYNNCYIKKTKEENAICLT